MWRDPIESPMRNGYSPDRTLGVVLVRHTPGTAAVRAHEGVVVVVHVVRARPILAFPAGWVVIIVAGVVGHAVLAVAGGRDSPVATVAVAAGAAAAAVVTRTGTGANVPTAGVRRRHHGAAGRGHRRRRTRVQREEVLLQPHRVARACVATRRQSQHVEALLCLPDVQPKVLGGAILLRLVPADGRIH